MCSVYLLLPVPPQPFISCVVRNPTGPSVATPCIKAAHQSHLGGVLKDRIVCKWSDQKGKYKKQHKCRVHNGRSVSALEEESPSHDALFIASSCDAAGEQELAGG